MDHFRPSSGSSSPGAEAVGLLEPPRALRGVTTCTVWGSALEHEIYGFGERQVATAAQLGTKVMSVQQLHDHVRASSLQGAYVENPGHVLAPDLHTSSGLSQEARDTDRLAAGVLFEKLQRDLLAQL